MSAHAVDLEGSFSSEASAASSIVAVSRKDQLVNFVKNNKKAVAGALGLLAVGLVAVIAVAASGDSSKSSADSALSSPSASISLSETICTIENDLVVVKGLPSDVFLYAKRSDTDAMMPVPEGDLFFWTGSSDDVSISFYTEESASDDAFVGAVECQVAGSSDSGNSSDDVEYSA